MVCQRAEVESPFFGGAGERGLRCSRKDGPGVASGPRFPAWGGRIRAPHVRMEPDRALTEVLMLF